MKRYKELKVDETKINELKDLIYTFESLSCFYNEELYNIMINIISHISKYDKYKFRKSLYKDWKSNITNYLNDNNILTGFTIYEVEMWNGKIYRFCKVKIIKESNLYLIRNILRYAFNKIIKGSIGCYDSKELFADIDKEIDKLKSEYSIHDIILNMYAIKYYKFK